MLIQEVLTNTQPCLLSPLPGVDPDDTYNETPYEKGYCFVSYLAHLVGDQDRFDKFLKVQSTLHEGRETRSR